MSNQTAFDRLVDALRDHGSTVRDTGHGTASAQCPAHDDGTASLSVGPRRDGKGVVVHCHAGCDYLEVLAALKFSPGDLFDEPKMREVWSPRRDYRYPGGRINHRYLKANGRKGFYQDNGGDRDRSLYLGDQLGADDEIVYVNEGEKGAEAMRAAYGVIAVSVGSATRTVDWSPLAGRNVVLVQDNDDTGREWAPEAVAALTPIVKSVKVVRAAVNTDKADAADHIAAEKGLEEFVPVPIVVQTPTVAAESDDDDKPQRRSVAAQLVDMARAHYRLGVTDTDDPFGVTAEHPHIALMLRGGKTGLRAELSRRYFAETNTVASQQALADACMVLEGYAAQENPQRVYLRVAEQAGAVYVDMGDTAGRVIEISGGKWRIVDTAPVLFRRTKLTGQLPHPHPGDLGTLWEFVPVDEADRPVLLAVLVAALVQVDVPHVILVLAAEQGSAKSTATRILVSLVDPSAVPLRQPPRDPDGWTTAAAASWVVALDNLSGEIPAWLSDCLCRASTGDGSVKRALYTDSDVSVLAFRRCVIGNGVDVVVDRGDLAERVARVGLPRVTTRRPEDELAAAWEAARPRVLGALLDLAAKVHERLPAIEVDDLPRMADFAKVLAAVDEVLGTHGLKRYREQSKMSAADTLDHPLTAALMEYGQPFEDKTSAEILAAVKPDDSGWKPPRGWPKNARAVTARLTRDAPALRSQGWIVEHDDGRNHRNATQWTIAPPERHERGRDSASHGSRDSQELDSRSSDGMRTRESGRESAASHNGAITRADSHNSHNSQLTTPLTCEDELASHASQEYAPSLVLCSCGVELSRPESIARGHCAECEASQ